MSSARFGPTLRPTATEGVPADVPSATQLRETYGVEAIEVEVWLVADQLRRLRFAFASDAEMPRADPEPILATEVHHGQNPGRSIRSAGDLAPHLDRADVYGIVQASEGIPLP